MAVDMFLKLTGIKGESLDHKHKDEIDVLSFSFGASQSGSHSTGGGGGAGKVSFQDFSIIKNVDSASPDLFDRICSGQHIQNGVFTARKAGKEQVDFYKVSFEDVLISSISPGGTGTDVPRESVSLNFASLKIEVRRQTASGNFGPWETTSCDLAGNKD